MLVSIKQKIGRNEMCHIFAGQDPANYAYQTRSVRLGGHATSIRLEGAFWDILGQISHAQGMALGKFLTTLHDAVLELSGDTHNFTSLLRCACLTYVAEVQGVSEAEQALRREAEKDLGERLVAAE